LAARASIRYIYALVEEQLKIRHYSKSRPEQVRLPIVPPPRHSDLATAESMGNRITNRFPKFAKKNARRTRAFLQKSLLPRADKAAESTA
jgi:hypothetical protein